MIYPLIVAKMTNTGDLIIIAGRRRFRALKESDWKNVPVLVQFKDVTETELRRIILLENLHRKDLVDTEKGFGILGVYEAAGAITGTKSIDNWFKNYPNKKWKELIEEMPSVIKNKPRHQANPLRYDQKFVEICKSIGYSPKYQCQLLQIVLQLKPDVLIEAQQEELSTEKKLLLTKSKLKEYPKLQKYLIQRIKSLTIRQAEVVVNQELRDIEIGYIIPTDADNFVYSEKPASEREIVKRKSTDKILDLPPAMELDIAALCDKFIGLLTGRVITRGEKRYKEIIDKNKERMYKIVKLFDGEIREMIALYEPLEVLEYTIKNMREILRQEREVAQNKKELGKK